MRQCNLTVLRFLQCEAFAFIMMWTWAPENSLHTKQNTKYVAKEIFTCTFCRVQKSPEGYTVLILQNELRKWGGEKVSGKKKSDKNNHKVHYSHAYDLNRAPSLFLSNQLQWNLPSTRQASWSLWTYMCIQLLLNKRINQLQPIPIFRSVVDVLIQYVLNWSWSLNSWAYQIAFKSHLLSAHHGIELKEYVLLSCTWLKSRTVKSFLFSSNDWHRMSHFTHLLWMRNIKIHKQG